MHYAAQNDRGEGRAYVLRLLQLGVVVGTATAVGVLLGRTALPALFTADAQVAPAQRRAGFIKWGWLEGPLHIV